MRMCIAASRLGFGSFVSIVAFLGALAASESVAAPLASAYRSDFSVTTSDGVAIHVREVRIGAPSRREPVVMVHGARVPGVASFDLEVPGGSLAEDLARRTGRTVYVMDARGYGGSDRPAAMTRPPEESRPLSRAYEVVRDIDAVVAAASTRQGTDTVALFGWASGGMWAGYYASLHPERVGHLMMFNALYGGTSGHAMLAGLADRANARRIDPGIGGYARYTGAQLLPVWDRSIPVEDKSQWRDPAIAASYTATAIASDPEDADDPPTFRAPQGAMEDSFLQAMGRRLYDASSITSRVLLVRSELDFWSRPGDVTAFMNDASRARDVQVVELRGATHLAHLDRAPHGRDRLIEALASFLDEGH